MYTLQKVNILDGRTVLEISDRATNLLNTLIELYIQEGRPVGSKTLAKGGGFALSSASIRKVMAELEEAGYIVSPHTSAGRVPTSKGYRLFVDGLVKMPFGDIRNLDRIKSALNLDQGVKALAESTSELLASFTKMASLVLMPKREQFILRHLEFLPLAGGRVLVILVFNEKEVQNRIIHLEQAYSELELKEAANFVNSEYAGMSLETICTQIEESLSSDRVAFGRLLEAVQEILPKAIEQNEMAEDQSCVVAGQSNLIDSAAQGEITNLKAIFDAFAKKRVILDLMQGCLGAEGVQIFIGEEAGSHMIEGFSLVTAPYLVEESLVGVLAVIGPTRMPYQKVIPTVDITAKILSSALNPHK